MAKDPEGRYATVEEPLAELRALPGETRAPPPCTRPCPARAGPGAWIAAAALLVLAVLLAVLLAYRFPPRGAGGTPIQATFTRLTDQEGSEPFPSLSPDGQLLRLRPPGLPGQPGPLPAARRRQQPDRSDGGLAAGRHPAGLLAGRQADRLPLGAGRRRHLPDGGDGGVGAPAHRFRLCNPAWSPGRPADRGRHRERLGSANRANEEPDLAGGRRHGSRSGSSRPGRTPCSRAGRRTAPRIAYWGIPRTGSQRVIWTVPAAGGEPVRVTDDAHLNWSPTWSPDGRSCTSPATAAAA